MSAARTARGRKSQRQLRVAAGEPRPVKPPPVPVAGTRPDDALAEAAAGTESDADRAVREIYGTQYSALVRLAALLAGDVRAAEEAVQESFVAMHGAWSRLRDHEQALSYLRHAVVSRSRSILPPAGQAPAGQAPAGQGMRSAVISAIRALPPMQREALVLRLYLELSEGEIASAMGTSQDAARDHAARGMAALRGAL